MDDRKMADVTLETVGGGALPELFEHAWAEVLKNIQDVNTEAKAVRQVTLTIAVKPFGDRDSGEIRVGVAVKTAPIKPVAGTVYFGSRDGKLVAVGRDPRQRELLPEDNDPSVRPIHHKAQEG